MAEKKSALWRFILKQCLRLVLLLVCVSILTFVLVSVSPINPLHQNVGQTALGSFSPEQILKLESYWGKNEPGIQRYLNWAGDLLKGDMGVSLLYRRNVSAVISEKIGNSFWILGIAWAVSGAAGLGLGILAGTGKDRRADRIIKSCCLFLSSTPAFWVALVLLMIFAVWLQILPIGLSVPIGMETAAVTWLDRVRHAILPALTLSIVGIPGIALHTREKMAEIMESDYVLFARARGLSRRQILWHHGLRNILLPAITLQFASFSEIIGGSLLAEQIFSYPGLGQAAVSAGLGGDIPLLMGITLICAGVVFVGNFIANLLYAIIDPRLRKRGQSL